MSINIKQIIEGYRNAIIPPKDLKDTVEKISEERMDICKGCQYNSDIRKVAEPTYRTIRPDTHCTYCSCNLNAKTSCLSCQCPVGKWKAYLTDEEERDLEQKLKTDAQD